MRIALGCIASALLGGLFAVLLVDARLAGRADAQDPPRDRAGPAFPDAPRARPGARLPPERPPLGDVAAGPADDELSPEERINVAVYESANRAVAHITTRGVREGMLLFDVPTEGTGSGSVIDKHGHILTNNHVIDGARQVTVTLFDGQSYEARLVGNDQIGRASCREGGG